MACLTGCSRSWQKRIQGPQRSVPVFVCVCLCVCVWCVCVCVYVCVIVWEKEREIERETDLSFLYKCGVVVLALWCICFTVLHGRRVHRLPHANTHADTCLLPPFLLPLSITLPASLQLLTGPLHPAAVPPPVRHPLPSLRLSIHKQHYCICAYDHIGELIKQKRGQ